MDTKKTVLFSAKWISYTALLTALVVAMGMVPGVPVLDGKIYWSDFPIFMAAYLLDPLAALIVGGVGTTFFDLFGINGTAYNAIPSLIIHGLQGVTAGFLFRLAVKFLKADGDTKKEMIAAAITFIVPALIVIFGYFVKRITVEGKLPEVALLKMPANVLQEIVGSIVAITVCFILNLKGRLKKMRLLPDLNQQ